MSQEFTTLKAAPPTRNLPRNPKSALLIELEKLKVGEVLQWRPVGEHSPKAAYSRAVQVRRSHGYTVTVRKVDLGYDIYRTA